jgi:hypothetical protein
MVDEKNQTLKDNVDVLNDPDLQEMEKIMKEIKKLEENES